MLIADGRRLMGMDKPLFEINDNIINEVVEITKKMSKLEGDLKRLSKIKWEEYNPYDEISFLKAVHMVENQQLMHAQINSLFAWAASSELNSLIKACVVHYELASVYQAGNNQVARLWQSVVLYNYDKLFELIPIESVIDANLQEYYHAIEISRQNNNSTVFIEFMLEMILRAIDSYTRRYA